MRVLENGVVPRLKNRRGQFEGFLAIFEAFLAHDAAAAVTGAGGGHGVSHGMAEGFYQANTGSDG